jgi:hypothetical protein
MSQDKPWGLCHTARSKKLQEKPLEVQSNSQDVFGHMPLPKESGLGTWNPERSHDQAHCQHKTWLQLQLWNKLASAVNYLSPLNSRCMEGSQEPKFVTNHLFSPVMSSLAYMGERSLPVSTKRINGKDICVICVTDMWHHTKEITVCFWSPDCTVLRVNFSYNVLKSVQWLTLVPLSLQPPFTNHYPAS